MTCEGDRLCPSVKGEELLLGQYYVHVANREVDLGYPQYWRHLIQNPFVLAGFQRMVRLTMGGQYMMEQTHL